MLCYVMYGSWDTDLDGQNVLPFWTIFCHFTSLTTQKIKFLKKWKKKTTGHIIILHMCTIMWCIYDSWNMKHDRQNEKQPEKSKFWKMKKCLEISFYTCASKFMIPWCMVPEK